MRRYDCWPCQLNCDRRSYLINHFMSQARSALDKGASWGNQREHMASDHHYWCCLGVFAKYKTAMREDTEFKHRRLRAYATLEELKQEQLHVRWAGSFTCPVGRVHKRLPPHVLQALPWLLPMLALLYFAYGGVNKRSMRGWHRCSNCQEVCGRLQRCSGCQSVAYCSHACQAKHWKAGHKQACQAP